MIDAISTICGTKTVFEIRLNGRQFFRTALKTEIKDDEDLIKVLEELVEMLKAPKTDYTDDPDLG